MINESPSRPPRGEEMIGCFQTLGSETRDICSHGNPKNKLRVGDPEYELPQERECSGALQLSDYWEWRVAANISRRCRLAKNTIPDNDKVMPYR